MVNTTTGRCSGSPTASRQVRLGRTRLRAAAALSRHLPIRLTRRFRSTTARDRTSSRRICASPRHLVLGNQPEDRSRDRDRAEARVVQAGPVEWAAAGVVPAVAVDAVVPAADLEVVLVVAPV